MSVENKTVLMNHANRMALELHHFARGSYPVSNQDFSVLPVNRFFLVIDNPGKEKCRIEDKHASFILKPGHCYFAPLHHLCRFLLDEELQFISIHFTLELYEGVDIFSGYGKVCEFSDSSWLERAKAAFDGKSEFAAALQLKGLTADFAAFLGNSMSFEQWESVTRFAPYKKELEYLQTRLPAQVTVDELAELHGVTRENFSRNFTRTTGITPKKFLTRMLVSRASRLLTGENRSIREIAFELGFNNEFYFSRFFSRETGLSPKAYKRIAVLK